MNKEQFTETYIPIKVFTGTRNTVNDKFVKDLDTLINSAVSDYNHKAQMFDQIAVETDSEWIVKLDCPNCADTAEVFFLKSERKIE